MDRQADPKTTEVLGRWVVGEGGAMAELSSILYDDLHHRAQLLMRGQRPGHTLQTTALVHEAWMRVVHAGSLEGCQRAQILALAAKAMRNLLIDHARARKSRKRGGSWTPAVLAEEAIEGRDSEDVLLDLDEALQRLEHLDPDLRQVAEMRLFGGLDLAEIAEALAVSTRTVERRWRFGRAWLQRELEAPN